MKKNSKKLCSLMLAGSMALSMAAPAFAAERSYEKELELSIVQESAEDPLSNRYDYVTVKGEKKLLYSESKSNGQFVTEQFIVDGINGAINCAADNFQQYWVPIKVGQLALNALVLDAHGIGSAVSFDYYSRIDVRYRVDSLTGQRTPVSRTYTLICEMSGGSDVKTYEWHKHDN